MHTTGILTLLFICAFAFPAAGQIERYFYEGKKNTPVGNYYCLHMLVFYHKDKLFRQAETCYPSKKAARARLYPRAAEATGSYIQRADTFILTFHDGGYQNTERFVKKHGNVYYLNKTAQQLGPAWKPGKM